MARLLASPLQAVAGLLVIVAIVSAVGGDVLAHSIHAALGALASHFGHVIGGAQ